MFTNDFIDLNLTTYNLDNYHIRSAIFISMTKQLPHFHGKLLDVGCGKMPYREYILQNSSVNDYIGLDLYQAIQYDDEVQPDCRWDGIEMPFENESFQTVIATEVLEHCPDPLITLKECFRVLQKGGTFFFTVPFLWNLHEIPHDEYRYTPYAIERLLKEAGFVGIKIRPHGGWHASLAQMLGLWARRAPMGSVKRNIISTFCKPLIRYLLRKDQKINWSISNPIMITGLHGVGKKQTK